MHLRHHNISIVYHTDTKITTIFRPMNTFFTMIKVDKFHDILTDIKIQAMLGRFTEHRLLVTLFS